MAYLLPFLKDETDGIGVDIYRPDTKQYGALGRKLLMAAEPPFYRTF